MTEWLVKVGVAYLIFGVIVMNLVRGWQQQPPPSFREILGWVGVIPYELSLYASQQELFNSHYQPAVYYLDPPKRNYDRWQR